MGLVKGLGAINKQISERQERMSGGDRVKAQWFKLGNGQAAKVIFLQEFDEGSDNYSEKNGLVALSTEHQAGNNWRIKAQCTDDDGACYGCEKHAQDPKGGWGQKQRLYANVLVDDGENEPYVAILSQSTSAQSITPSLMEQAEELGTITDKWFKISRRGEKKDTTYILTPLRPHAENVEDYELFDLDTLVPNPSYDKQPEFYNRDNEADEDEGVSKPPVGAGVSSHDEW